MGESTRTVLFLCTGNSARSILAEALLSARGAPRYRGASAGSFPRGEVHPMALTVLRAHSIPVAGFRSKSWDEFAGPDAPLVDAVVTVCDNAAAEACPIWPGRPNAAHWAFADPAAVDGPEQRAAFEATFAGLDSRIAALLALPPQIDRAAFEASLRAIGAEPVHG